MLYVVGSLNVDLISYAPTFPRPGETVQGSFFQQSPGGKGANQAAAAARLCGPNESTRMVGAVGDDALGKEYISPTGLFASSGVLYDGVAVISGATTGVAPITVNSDGENCIVVIPGANQFLSETHVVSCLRGLSHSSSILLQLEVNPAATLAALKCAVASGSTTFLTPAPVPSTGLGREFLELTSVLIPNELEARMVAAQGRKFEEQEGARLSMAQVADCLFALGVKAVVITLGAKGAFVYSRSDGSGTTAVEVHAPLLSGGAVDTTGAGDCFSGSLAYFYTFLKRGSQGTQLTTKRDTLQTANVDVGALLEATRRAVFVAAMSVTRRGTQTSYFSRKDLPSCLFLPQRCELPTTV